MDAEIIELLHGVLTEVRLLRDAPRDISKYSWLREKDAAKFLALSVSMIQKLRAGPHGPPFAKFGTAVRYRSDLLDQWANQRAAVGDEP